MDRTQYTGKRDFWRRIVRDLAYSTPGGKAWWPARRIPGWATLQYHLGTDLMILIASARARMGRLNNRGLAGMCQNVMQVIESCGGRFEIAGLKHLDRGGGPFVFSVNHMSSVEALVLAALIGPFSRVTFVVKETLLRYPVFGPIARSFWPIALRRDNPRDDLRQVMEEGALRTEGGFSVVIFPQSTRSEVFDQASFNSLGAKLAARAGVPLIPVAVKTDFLGNGRIVKDIGRVDPARTIRIEFGAPIAVQGRGRAEHEQTVRFIAGRLEQWGGLVQKDAKAEG